MGMFNTVQFNCPTCGELLEVQTKSGSCSGAYHWANRVPLADVDGLDKVVYCFGCAKSFVIKPETEYVSLSLVLEEQHHD